MNHTRIALNALHYRMSTVNDPATASRFDPEELAVIAVECADADVDSAIRRIATAWVNAGFAREGLGEPWPADIVDQRFAGDPTLLDSIDVIIKAAHRVQFSRRRGHSPDRRPSTSARPFFADKDWART